MMNKNSKKNKSILIISGESEFINDLKRLLNPDYNYTFFENNKFYLLNGVIGIFDVIIFDNSKDDLQKFIDVFKLTKSYNFNIPVILIEDTI